MPHFSIVVLHGFTSWLVPWAYPKVSIVPWWLCSEPFLSTFHWQCSAPLLKDMWCATSTWITFPSQVLGWLKPSRFEATIWPIRHPWLREPRSIVVQPWEIEKRHKAPHWVLFRSQRLYPDRTSSNVKEVYLPTYNLERPLFYGCLCERPLVFKRLEVADPRLPYRCSRHWL